MSATAAGDRSVAVAGDVVDSIIVTGDNADVRLVVGAEDGARLERMGLLARRRRRRRAPPLGAPPAPYPGHLDREDALAAVRDVRTALNVHGERGIGKTWALAEALGGAQGGVVWLDAKGCAVDDVLQDLFRAFWDCEPPCVLIGTPLRDALADVMALVVVDGLTAEEDDAQRLVAAAPRCRFVLASRDRVLWSSEAHAVRGLRPADGLRVVEQELGRELRADERAQAERLCAEAGGNPLRIRQAVARRESGGAADDDERRVVAALALFGETAVGADRLAEITGVADVAAVLERLRARHVVAAHSPRYSLLVEAEPDPDVLGRALAAFTRAPAEGPALALLHRAHDAGRDEEAVALARAASPILGARGHWAAWDRLLETALHAARRAGDRDGEGWALHQLGTLAFCLGRVPAALDLLQRALEKRDARVTRHNLRFVRGGGGGLPSKAAMGGLLAVMAVGGAAVAIAVGGGDEDPPPPEGTQLPATTTSDGTTGGGTTGGGTTRGGTTEADDPVLTLACPPEVREREDETGEPDPYVVPEPVPARPGPDEPAPPGPDEPAPPGPDVVEPEEVGGGTTAIGTDVSGGNATERPPPYVATLSGTLTPGRPAPIEVTVTDRGGATVATGSTPSDAAGRWAIEIEVDRGRWTARAQVDETDGAEAEPCPFFAPG